MATDAHAAMQFYATARGATAAALLRARLAALWPPASLAGKAVLGLGYTSPYLRAWRGASARCIALTPNDGAPGRWPHGAPNLSCTAEEDALPFPDLCFDRILLLHGLETADHARRLLREVWRVLKDDGRLIVATANRRGLWAHAESTPFGQGQPYSQGQIGRLLAASLFRVERRDAAVFVPPTNLRLLLRGAAPWERAGRLFAPRFAGVTIAEAVKDIYAALPVAVPARRLVLEVA